MCVAVDAFDVRESYAEFSHRVELDPVNWSLSRARFHLDVERLARSEFEPTRRAGSQTAAENI
jgi:hypothetical protein